ncbi:hypothetical protein HOY80DRAFT_1133837 [Tuber brumale]|nr:hypothetical protein HOY80DRAFT_1133837 [Tuber brumale]
MPQKDDGKCLMCGREFGDARATKRHLKKFRHFVKTETAFQDTYRPSPRRHMGCALRARPEYTISQRRQTRRRRTRRSLGHSSRSGGSSASPESSSSEHGRSPGSKKNQSSNDDGPAAPEQRRSPVLETPQGHENGTCAPTSTTQPSDGSVTSATSPEHPSDSAVGQDLDETPLEEYEARYLEREEGGGM